MSDTNNEPRNTQFQIGNRAAEVIGVTTFLRRGPDSLDEDMRASHFEFLNAVIADHGGPSEISALKMARIERVAELNTLANLLARDLARRGVLSPRGRVRSSVDQFLKTLDRFDRMSKLLGFDRVAKRVPSIADVFNTPDEP